MADSESEGVEIEDGPPGVIPGTATAATAATTAAAAAADPSTAGPSTAGPGTVSRSGRPTRSAAARGGSKRTATSSAVASIFSSSESSETATDGDDDDEADTDYTQTRGSDDDDEEESEDDSGTDAGGGGGSTRRGRPRGRVPSYSRGASSPSRSRSPSVAYSDGGYTSGFTTGDESGDDLFDEDLDPMSLLMELEQQGAAAGTAAAAGAAGGGDGAYGGGTSASALQPFELIRERRRAHRLAAAGHGRRGGGRPGASDEDEDLDALERGTEATGDVEMEDASTGPAAAAATAGGGAAAPTASDAGGGGATPATGGRGGRGRGRGRGGGRTPASTASGGRGRGRGGGGSSRRRASDIFGADVDDILDDPLAERLGLTEPGSSRRRGRGRGRGRGRPKGSRRRGRPKRGLPEEVVAKLGQANVMYALRDYQPAIELLTQVIKIYPNISDPYHTLGLLHEANGQPRKALDFFMIAAHLSPKDISLWKRLASMSTELGFYRQAVYCLTKAINRNRGDLDAMWDRAVLYAQVGDTDKAQAQFAEVGRARPGDPEVPVMQARLHHQGGAPLKAIAVLEAHLRDHPGNVDLTHINILAELYMERGGYMEARALIERAAPVLCPDQPLPLDLAVKSGLCLAHTGRWDEADEVLGELLREPVEQFGDLYLAVGSALAGLGQHDKALQYLTALLEHPDLNEPELWTQLLRCHVALGEVAGGLELYRAQMQALETTDPRYPAAAVSLAEMCLDLGEQGRTTALEMISVLDGILDRARSDAAEAEAAEAAAPTDDAGAGPSTSTAAGARGAAARAPGAAGGGLGTAAEVLGEDLAMRLSTLYLKTGMLDRYVLSIRPSVEMSLGALANDLARVNDPSMPAPLRRAILRRRMFARKGGRKGESKEETGSVFKGATRKDRRTARTREYDRQAAEMLGLPVDTDGGASGGSGLEGSGTEGTDGGGGGSDSGGDLSGGEGRRKRGSTGPRLPRGGLVGPSVLSDPAQAQVLLQLTRALVLVGRPEEANAMLDKAIALVASAGGGTGAGGDGGVNLAGLANKRAGGPWFDRATIDRLRLGKLELASMMATAGLEPRPAAASKAAAAAGAGKKTGAASKAAAAAAAAAGVEPPPGGGEILDAAQLAALRTLTIRWPYSIGLWNLYCSAHAQGTDLRSWAVQITTLRRRHPTSVPLMVLQGHVYLLARQFREAASEYFHAYRFTPEEPLLLLCLAVALLSDALGSAAAVAMGSGAGGAAQLPPQRHTRAAGAPNRDRNRGVLAGFAFLQAYQKARGGQLSQEVAYNMGRAAHQLGLLHIAHHYYEAALAAPPATGLPIWQSMVAGAAPPGGGAAGHDATWATHGSERWDLRREIAHNLVQLYRSSGASALARSVMAKYLVF